MNFLSKPADNLHETQPSQVAAAQNAPRFLYASGARPLEGFTIKRGIGRGGFGEVYFATSDGGKEVALKLIRRNMDVEIRGVGHCMNLKHPNLLSVHDVRRDGQGETWIIMEYVSGASLEDVIEANPHGLAHDEVLRWFHSIADGLAYLHEHGIVHRDLKPANIFVDEGIVKIGDYGLSKFISCSRRSGQTESVGTVHYMAPEVANGRYGKEIDIYALAVILYELLTGNVPFDGESVGEVLMKHLTAEPKLDSLAEPFRSVLKRGLSKDPAARFTSVRDFSDALPPSSAVPGGAAGGVRVNAQAPLQGEQSQHTSVGTAPRKLKLSWWNDPSREPIYHAIKAGLIHMGRAWKKAQIPGFVRFCCVCLLFFPAIRLLGAAPAILFVAAPIYSVYYVLRAVLLAALGYEAPPAPAPLAQKPKSPGGVARGPEPLRSSAIVQPFAGPAPVARVLDDALAPSKEQRKRRWSQRPEFKIPAKTIRQHAAELLGGMLFASIICGLGATAVMFLTVRSRAALGIDDVARGAWLALVSTAGAWIVLLTSKLWEGRDGDPHHRRFGLMCLGGLLGAYAFNVKQYLQVFFPYDTGMTDPLNLELEWFRGNPWMWQADGQPAIGVALAYYASVFVLLRWWKNADPLRSHRLGVLSTLLPVLVAWGLGSIWAFPQPIGLASVAIMVVAVELSSPWIPLEDRKVAA